MSGKKAVREVAELRTRDVEAAFEMEKRCRMHAEDELAVEEERRQAREAHTVMLKDELHQLSKQYAEIEWKKCRGGQ